MTLLRNKEGNMKRRIATMIAVLLTIAVILGNPGELEAQVTGVPSPELMEFYAEWAILYPMEAYISALLAYNEMLYEGKKVTVDECVKVDEAIATIAGIMKKAWTEVKDNTIRAEMQLVADTYINACKAYGNYHRTGKQEERDKADKLLEGAGEHWEKVGKYLEGKFGGGEQIK